MQVPAGRVTTCGDLAGALGNRIAATWVGYFTLHHDHDAGCVCHRIVRAGGMLGPFITTIEAKAQCLADEGVVVRDSLVDLERFGFRDFTSDRPLEQLRQVQEEIQARIVVQSDSTAGQAGSPSRAIPELIGGVDVAYPNADEGVAAYALVETATGQLVWSTTIRRRVTFPYISTYLSFREIPILLCLLDEVRSAGRMAEVLLVDGSGILHHRHVGIASHFGVVASIPTIGVTKKLLCGEVNIERMTPGESLPVVHEGEPIGIALRPTAAAKGTVPFSLTRKLGQSPGSRRPIFISPGHRVDLPFCERVVRQLLTGHRLPELLYWADHLSKAGKKTAGVGGQEENIAHI